MSCAPVADRTKPIGLIMWDMTKKNRNNVEAETSSITVFTLDQTKTEQRLVRL